MALKFHCVAAFSDEAKFERVIYAGDDGEAAVRAYHAARDAAEFPTLAYFRKPMHSKRCRTVKPVSATPVPAESSLEERLKESEKQDGVEEEESEDLAELVAKAGKGRGKK